MRNVRVVFVTPKHKGLMKVVSNLVCGITGSKWSHVGVHLVDGIFEAVMPQVMVSPSNKYDPENVVCAEIVTLKVTDAGYKRIVKAAEALIGDDIKYGIIDCIIAGWADLVSNKQACWMAGKLGSECNKMCAGIVCRVLKASRDIDDLDKFNDEIITPQEMYSVLKFKAAEKTL